MKVIRIDPERGGCHGSDYGDGCPLARYAGGLDRCATCGEVTDAPAPDGCPLRSGGVAVMPPENGTTESPSAAMASRAESLEKTVATLGARVDAMLLDLANVAQERNQLRKERDAALAETERLRAHAETIIRRTTDERDAARVERDSARTELRRVYDELGRISGLVELLK